MHTFLGAVLSQANKQPQSKHASYDLYSHNMWLKIHVVWFSQISDANLKLLSKQREASTLLTTCLTDLFCPSAHDVPPHLPNPHYTPDLFSSLWPLLPSDSQEPYLGQATVGYRTIEYPELEGIRKDHWGPTAHVTHVWKPYFAEGWGLWGPWMYDHIC